MRVSGGGHEKLMVIIPMAVVLVLAVIAMGGPAPLLGTLDRYIGDFFAAAYKWVRSAV